MVTWSVRAGSTPKLRATVVVAVTALLGTIALAAGQAASAAPTTPGIFLACGYGSIIANPPNPPAACQTLPDAITAAEGYGTDATVLLEPGLYCPFSVPATAHHLRIAGSTPYVVDGNGQPISFSGPEAGAVAIRNDNAHCGGGTSAVTVDNLGSGRVILHNLTIDGTGLSYGLEAISSDITLRDVIVQNAPTIGLKYVGDDLVVENSAFTGNHTGISFSGEGSIDESTIAGNTAEGLFISNGYMHLDNDTIAHNQTGVDIYNSGNTVQVANSIVGGNTSYDCTGTMGDWEVGSGNGHNLVGSCSVMDPSDIALTDTIGAIQNSGVSPHIDPPGQAGGAAETGACGSTNTDQNESLYTPGQACDIGSINPSANEMSELDKSQTSIDFEDVNVGDTDTRSVTLSNAGGGVLAVAKVTVSAGFKLASDTCSSVPQVPAQGYNGCFVNVSVTPSEPGPVSGTLKIKSTGGQANIPLTANGIGDTPAASALAAHASTTIPYGAATKVSAVLTDATSHAVLTAQQVDLLARTGSATFHKVTTATSDSHGKVSVRVTPHVNTHYEWSYPGSSAYKSTTSSVETVSVAAVVHVKAVAHRVAKQHKATFYGTVSPTESGKKVTLERQTHSRWHELASATIKHQTLPNGDHATGYVVHYTPTAKGTETLRVSRAATSSNAAGHSAHVTLHVT